MAKAEEVKKVAEEEAKKETEKVEAMEPLAKIQYANDLAQEAI